MKHFFLVFFALCFFTLKTQAQVKWNCGEGGAANVVADFDGATQTLTITGKGKMCMNCHPWDILSEAIKIVIINQGVTSIPNDAFMKFINLNTVTIPNGVIDIGYRAFEGTVNLRKIDIPNSVSSIGYAAFRESGLESISLPQSIVSVDHSIFGDCISLKTADLSKTQISRLPEDIFNNCVRLEDVFFPQKLKSFTSYSILANCQSLKSITCYNSTPIDIGHSMVFRGAYMSKVTLYVPEASVVIYKFSNVWKEFGKIEAIPLR